MRLVTWNTQWCCGLDGLVSPARIVDGARALADFDVLCLQEISQGFDALPGHPGDQPAQLQALLPGYRLFFGAAVDDFSCDGTRRRFGNLIATRLPVLHVQHHPLPWPADAGVRCMPRMCTVVTLRDPVLGPLRVMTTHLEYYSKAQRMAQARALRDLHAAYCALALAPPEALPGEASAFSGKAHTIHALLCGDFNLEPADPEYPEIVAPFEHGRFHDAWSVLNGTQPHRPTFRLFDRTYGPEPVACDFCFASDSLVPSLKQLRIDAQTRASDHQPVVLELG